MEMKELVFKQNFIGSPWLFLAVMSYTLTRINIKSLAHFLGQRCRQRANGKISTTKTCLNLVLEDNVANQ